MHDSVITQKITKKQKNIMKKKESYRVCTKLL